MTRTEFKQVGTEVFAELMPRTKNADVQEFLSTFLAELQDQGLEIEDDEDPDEEEESDDDSFED